MLLLCKACSFTVFCQKKMSQKKKKRKEKKETPRWTDISGPGPVNCLSRSSMYYIMLTLHNPIKPLNIVSTVFLEDLNLHLQLRGVQTT